MYTNDVVCLLSRTKRKHQKNITLILNKDFLFAIACQRAVVVAQLAERSTPSPEFRRSNPVIKKIHTKHGFTINCRKDVSKEKEAGNGPSILR